MRLEINLKKSWLKNAVQNVAIVFINEILAQVEHADYLQLIKSSVRRGLKLESSQKVKLFKLSIKIFLLCLFLFVKTVRHQEPNRREKISLFSH
jgi:hypothetical protein